MNPAASPFSRRALLIMLGVGAAAFVLILYAIGAGWTGREDRDGGAHAAANGFNGFSGLAQLLEARGYPVSLSRTESRLDDEGLLVLTPPMTADADDLDEIIEARRYFGPTLIVLPKWFGTRGRDIPGVTAPKGWVVSYGASAPGWLSELRTVSGASTDIGERDRWHGLGLAGRFPDTTQAMAIYSDYVLPLVSDSRGDVLAGFLDDGGAYPVLDEAGGYPYRDPDEMDLDTSRWAVVVVAEPDLMNNYGMAEMARAQLAEQIVLAAREGEDIPIVFDLTLPGLGANRNLLTLAFEPPFLAATLCLLLAALVIAWRAFRRFGPPVAEAPATAMGKRQLAINGGALVERAGRIHLLGAPYAALTASRIARLLGVRESDSQTREEALARILSTRGIAADFQQRMDALRNARTAGELLRAAAALRTIERTLTS